MGEGLYMYSRLAHMIEYNETLKNTYTHCARNHGLFSLDYLLACPWRISKLSLVCASWSVCLAGQSRED
jgi:hypothetical protein